MSESTSVGSIQMDMTISQDSLNKEMSRISGHIGKTFKSMFSGMASQTTNFVRSSLGSISSGVRSFSQAGVSSSDKVTKSVSKMGIEYEKTESKITNLRKELKSLVSEQSAIAKGFGDFPAFTGMTKEDSMNEMLKSNPRYNELSEQITQLTSKMDPLMAKNKTLKKQIDSVGESAKRTGNKLSSLGRNSDKASKSADKATLKTRLFGNEMKKSGTKAVGFAAMINKSFMTIVKRLFVYNLILKGIRGLMSYTGAALKTNKQFVNSLNQIKTNLMVAFQPIYDYILPALNALMRAVATVTTYIASAISALFGKSYKQSFGAAKGLESAKKGMDGYGKAAKKAGKEAKGALSGFDEINQLDISDNADDGDSGGGGGFEMEMPDTSTIDMSGIERFKEIMASMFDPFKLAWEKEGQATIDSIKGAFSSILGLAEAIGKSWLDVWTNGTGQVTVENILRVVQGLLDSVGNLSMAFKTAWEENEVGTRIVQNMFDMFNIILETIGRIAGATAEWARTLDFTPLLESISALLEALNPLTWNIGDGLVWLWENALLPLSGWVIEDVIPRFLDILAESLNILNGVIDALKPLWQWLWDNFFEAIAKWTGGVIVSVLDGIIGALKSIGDWISNNKTAVETMAIVIGSFMAAWEIVSLAKIIGGIVEALVTFISTGGLATAVMTAFKAAILFLTSPIGIAVVAIGALIATGVLLYKHWDVVKDYATKTWDGIKNVFTTFENWLTNSFSKNWSREFGLFGDVINAFFKNAKNIFDGVKQVFQGIITFLTGTFTGNWRKAFQGLADIMKGITSTFVAIMKAPLNGVIGLMNSAISGLNKIKVPDWVPGVGGKGVSITKIPMLAKGGIIDQPTLAMVGERGKEAVMPLENNTGWITDLANQIASVMGGAGGNNGSSGDTTLVVKIGEDTLVEKIISGINRRNRISGETVINV